MYETKLDNGSTVLGLFATPVYTTNIPPELSVAANFFDKLEHKGGDKEMEYGSHSANSYVMHEPECKELGDWIMTHVKEFGTNMLKYDYEEYAFSQTWVTWKAPGQFHTIHSHPNSLISAVFFYGYVEEETPAITFHKPVGGIQSSYLQPKHQADRREAEFSWETFSISFQPGMLLIFPSYFMHSVPVNNTQYIRKSLSMNILPKGKIGDENSLTELIFDKVI